MGGRLTYINVAEGYLQVCVQHNVILTPGMEHDDNAKTTSLQSLKFTHLKRL